MSQEEKTVSDFQTRPKATRQKMAEYKQQLLNVVDQMFENLKYDEDGRLVSKITWKLSRGSTRLAYDSEVDLCFPGGPEVLVLTVEPTFAQVLDLMEHEERRWADEKESKKPENPREYKCRLCGQIDCKCTGYTG